MEAQNVFNGWGRRRDQHTKALTRFGFDWREGSGGEKLLNMINMRRCVLSVKYVP